MIKPSYPRDLVENVKTNLLLFLNEMRTFKLD